MPPSPSPRRSLGHSFVSILPAKSKDDELTLFKDMQKNERDNFLLESAEDFDESICEAHKYHCYNLPPVFITLYLV